MKYITWYKLNNKVTKIVFASKLEQDWHTGKLWDSGLMDKIDWIDYDEVMK